MGGREEPCLSNEKEALMAEQGSREAEAYTLCPVRMGLLLEKLCP